MRKVLPILIITVFLLFGVSSAYAQQSNPLGTGRVNVKASIGEFYLSISGYIAPYASIILTSDGIYLRGTVADSSGNFYISQVLIKKGFTNFCLKAVDFKRIGESETCITVPPANGNIEKKEIFLPPTLGLERTEMLEGQETRAFGYSMPGAIVTLHLSNGQVITTTADSTGYYEIVVNNLKAGTYELYSTAELNQKKSLEPTTRLKLRSLTPLEGLFSYIRDVFDKFYRFFTSFALGPLWLALPLIILIIILILKLWPEKFTFIYDNKLIGLMPKKKSKKLHHSWWMGY